MHVAVILYPMMRNVVTGSIDYLTCWGPEDKARLHRLSEQEDHKGLRDPRGGFVNLGGLQMYTGTRARPRGWQR